VPRAICYLLDAGVSFSPMCLSYLIADPSNHYLFAMPFVLSGVIKIIYDVNQLAAFLVVFRPRFLTLLCGWL
jgi:hypothetical protein